MKRTIGTIRNRPVFKAFIASLIVVASLFAIGGGQPFAAGSCAASDPLFFAFNGSQQRCVLNVTCTASDTDGSFPNYTINPLLIGKGLLPSGISGWYLFDVYTDPGTTGPTDSYDITLTNALGYAVSAGYLDNRSATATERALGSAMGYPMIIGYWTMAIANNNVNSASVVVQIIFTSN